MSLHVTLARYGCPLPYPLGGGVEIFFVTYFRKVLPISQIVLTKKLGSSDVRQTPNLRIYKVYDLAKGD
jgi:hypothetical protein